MSSRMIISSLLLFLLVLSCPVFAPAAQVPPKAQSEIRHLLGYVEQSECQFYRNGVWHQDTKAARKHLELKYDYFSKKGRIESAEDFIKWCATKSEMSGRPYLVKLGDGEDILLSQWLIKELERYRKKCNGMNHS